MMITNKTPKLVAIFFSLLALMGGFSSVASAQILDDVSIREENDNIVVTIKLTAPVHYLRHFPVKQGRVLDIYYNILPGAAVDSQFEENEMRKSPPSDLISSFSVASQLENNQNELVLTFDRDLEYSVSAGKDNQSFLIFIRKAKPGIKVMQQDLPEIKQAPSTESDKQAAALMMEGRDALQSSNYTAAIEAFNKLLLLPSNKYTQDAQEWIGVARERAGQTDKARLEYESYLKLYSSGARVSRVQERLASLPAQTAQPAEAKERAKEKKATQTTTWGSLSMHYYHGASANDSTTTVGNTLNQSAFAETDQSSMITDFDISMRYRSDEYDNRLVFRDSFSKNFLDNPSRNKLNAAYFELKKKAVDLSGRFGRQSATGGGVMGRFDGASVGYGFLPKLRANVVAGRLADTSSYASPTQPVFYGAKLDMVGSGEGWNGSVYAINQTLESITDRRAVGTELRYFETSKTVFALVDYDTSYKVVNTAMLQGTINGAAGTTYNFLVDHRKSPSIGTRNALNGATTTSVNTMLQTMSETDLRELAKARTSSANLVQIGVAHPVSEKWQLGGDIKVSNVSSMSASGRDSENVTLCPLGTTSCPEGLLPFTAGTGNETTVTAQAIGSNIFSSQDISVFSLSHINSSALSGLSFFVSNRATVREKWLFDTTVRLYRDNNSTGITTTRVSPTLKVTYTMIKEKLNFEMEGGGEATNTSGNGTTSKTTRKFYSLGFRWDF